MIESEVVEFEWEGRRSSEWEWRWSGAHWWNEHRSSLGWGREGGENKKRRKDATDWAPAPPRSHGARPYSSAVELTTTARQPWIHRRSPLHDSLALDLPSAALLEADGALTRCEGREAEGRMPGPGAVEDGTQNLEADGSYMPRETMPGIDGGRGWGAGRVDGGGSEDGGRKEREW
jgi:hypothetical protein